VQAEQHIAEGAEHIQWQREVVAILERISTSAEAIEGARALLTALLDAQAQREQDREHILDCNRDSSSTVPPVRPVDQRNEAVSVAGIARPRRCADRTPVQSEAKKIANLGEGRSSETGSFDAVLQDEVGDRLHDSRGSMQCATNDVTHFMPIGNAAAIEPKVVKGSDVRSVDITFPSPEGHSLPLSSINFVCDQHHGARYNPQTIRVSFILRDRAKPEIQCAVEQGKLPVSQAAILVEQQHQIADAANAGYVWRIVLAAAAWTTALGRCVAHYRSRRETRPNLE
jgi:hypothetical protein